MKRLIILSAVFLLLRATHAFGQARGIENVGLGTITIIEMGNNGDIWVGSAAQGVGFYNGTTQQGLYFNQANTPQFKSDSVTSLTFGNIGGAQHVFIGTKNGLVYNRAGVWDTLNVPARLVTGVSLSNQDTLWASTGNGIVSFDSAKHLIRTYNTGNSTIPYNQTSSSQKGGKPCTGMVIGTPSNGAYYTKDYSTFIKIDTTVPNSKLVDNRVTTIYRDNGCNRYLIGTRGGLSFCPEGVPCQNFTTANGLPQNFVTSIAVDCHGDIWVGMKDSGVVVYHTPGFTRITTANGLSDNQITSISFPQGECKARIASADGNISVLDSNKNVVQILNAIADVTTDQLMVSIYPQPASGKVNFVLGKELANGEITLTDLSGRAVQNLSIRNATSISADVSSLPDGLYFYRISSDGQQLKTGKVQVMR